MRSLFVAMHKPRVASHVGGQYRRQPTLNPVWWLLRHGTEIQPIGYGTTDQTTVPCASLRDAPVDVVVGTFETCRPGLTRSAVRGRPECAGRPARSRWCKS